MNQLIPELLSLIYLSQCQHDSEARCFLHHEEDDRQREFALFVIQ